MTESHPTPKHRRLDFDFADDFYSVQQMAETPDDPMRASFAGEPGGYFDSEWSSRDTRLEDELARRADWLDGDGRTNAPASFDPPLVVLVNWEQRAVQVRKADGSKQRREYTSREATYDAYKRIRAWAEAQGLRTSYCRQRVAA